ncbi:GIY-YIG nuclease family protein [Pyxidicoccus fallax]|uniref:GIY-YIG nuclease family protein n=1 Tax=Pyxidicoccus fallax TaxID=394095 RepID=A0A848LBQ8_9BACT|nr:GIY-YIG nuclease family protein [Pyxidicoccus fallax]NPC87017.1 GIY-YIG nuclease family protein [Pyxidicoccus fallax]
MSDDSPSWTVYMLRCRDGTLYTGATNNLERRLATHGRGRGAAYTRARLPVTLVWSEPAGDRGAALRREAAIKRLSRGDKLLLVGAAARRKPPRKRK